MHIPLYIPFYIQIYPLYHTISPFMVGSILQKNINKKHKTCWFYMPRCSMYGIFSYIWAIFGVNVGKYSIHGASGMVNPQYFASHLGPIRAASPGSAPALKTAASAASLSCWRSKARCHFEARLRHSIEKPETS